ncbi:SDR family oxidoreductase [Streptomyces sp. SID1121]|uniref:SDR family oxidoreductase n=1 Tax=Streptomyces sp. SID1121 TaxID=3425888 RepID=UPI004056E8B4
MTPDNHRTSFPPDGRSAFPLRGAVALVTGANRGIGRAFTRELLDRGAAKAYAGARDPSTVQEPGVLPVRLDVTDPEQVAAAADRCGDVDLLVNNAGIFHAGPLLGAPSVQDAREEMETNLFGTLAMIRAFAPILGRNDGGAVIVALSALSFINYAPWGTYSASKAAAWSMTNSVRDELADQGTLVTAVHSGLVDTDMTQALELPKISPEVYVDAALDAVAAGEIEALADEHTHTYRAMLAYHPHRPPWD